MWVTSCASVSTKVAKHSRKATQGLKPPRTRTQLQSFLELKNYSRRFVPNFARLAVLLILKLRNNEPFYCFNLHYRNTVVMVFLQTSLTTPPVLFRLRAELNLTVDTNAFNKHIRCVMLQKQLYCTTTSIGYWSRSLNGSKKCDTTRCECLATVWIVFILLPYIECLEGGYFKDTSLQYPRSLLVFINTKHVRRHGQVRRLALFSRQNEFRSVPPCRC